MQAEDTVRHCSGVMHWQDGTSAVIWVRYCCCCCGISCCFLYLTWPQQHQRADCAGQQRTRLLVTVLVVPNSYVSQLVQSWVSCCRSKRLSKGMASMMRQKLAAHVVLVEHGEQ